MTVYVNTENTFMRSLLGGCKAFAMHLPVRQNLIVLTDFEIRPKSRCLLVLEYFHENQNDLLFGQVATRYNSPGLVGIG